MNDLQSRNVLMMPIIYNGREYLTSHRIHADYKAVGGEKYISVSEFNRMIRTIEAYPDYLVAENIVEISTKSQVVDFDSNADLALLIKSNSYKPVMLLDKAANVAVMNFLENESSRQFAVQGNNYLAEKLTAGPSLEDFVGCPPMVSPAAVNGYTIADVTDRRDDELKGQGGAAGAELPTQPAQHGEKR